MTRSIALLGVPLVVAQLACSAPPAPAPAPKNVLYVTNERGGTLSMIDVDTQTMFGTVTLGKRPRGIVASPDKTRLYVALSGSPIAGPGVDESTLPPPDKGRRWHR